MGTHTLLRIAALAALASTPVAAQAFDQVGNSVGGGDDIIVPIVLPFFFTFPDGTSTDMINVSTNGRIFPGGLGTSDLSETVADLLSQDTSICAYWDDLDDFANDDNQIFYNDLGSVAVISWVDIEEFNGLVPWTMQVQLRNDDSITIVWDERVLDIDRDAIVGISQGGGTFDPGPVNLSDASAGGVISVGTTAYELFGLGEFDLANGATPTGLVFTRTPFGYDITGNVPAQGAADPGRRACPVLPRGLTFTPMGSGYVLSDGSNFDSGFQNGIALNLSDDSTSVQPLPFVFSGPGGNLMNSLGIDSNGRVFDGGVFESSDFTPSIGELTTDPVVQICPLWTDFNPTDPDSTGNVWFHQPGPNSVSVTWSDITQFTGSERNTVQVRLFSDGTIQFTYVELNIDEDIDNFLIGLSPGSVLDPGETDMSAAAAISILPIIYEFFDTAGGVEDFDMADGLNANVALVPGPGPRIGETFTMDVATPAGATGAVYFIGLPAGIFSPPIDLGMTFPALTGCFLLVDIAFMVPVNGTPGTPAVLLDVPNAPFLVGFNGFSVQGVVINPLTIPLLTPTDELRLTIGS